MIGEALAAACGDAAVLARLGGGIGAAARAAQARLAAAPAAERRALRTAWAAAARAPVPPGVRGVHPSWIEAALAGLPARARADLARGGAGAPASRDAAIAVWLVRWACAELPPLPAGDAAGPPASIDEAVRLRGAALETWLAEAGADQLALALGAAGPEAIASAAAHAGGEDGARLRRAAARIAVAPRAGALGPVRAAIARCRGGGAHAVLGARAIAPYAVEPLVRRQLAVKLPRPLGLAIEAALAGHATVPLAHAPSWAALAAPVAG